MSILGQCIGIVRDQRITPEAAIALLERRSDLTRAEASVVALDYFGLTRGEIAAQLCISVDTLKCYWRRAYRKRSCHSRAAMRRWVEKLIASEIKADDKVSAL